MVSRRSDAIDFECIGDFLDLFSTQTIDNSAPTSVFQSVLHHLFERVHLGAHFVKEIGGD